MVAAAGAAAEDLSRMEGEYGARMIGKLKQMDVLIVGLKGLGVEVAKNLILAGPHSVTLYDQQPCAVEDLGSNFYLTPETVGLPRGPSLHHALGELNPNVNVQVHAGDITAAFLQQFDVVTVTTDNYPLALLREWNSACRERHRPNAETGAVESSPATFLLSSMLGCYGWLFADFGPSHVCFDDNGVPAKAIVVDHISRAEHGVVTIDGDRHLLNDGDLIKLEEVQGMSDDAMQTHHDEHYYQHTDTIANINSVVEVKTTRNPKKFTIGDTRQLGEYVSGGVGLQVKKQITFAHQPLQLQLLQPTFISGYMDFTKFGRDAQLHLARLAVWEFQQQHRALPRLHSAEDADALVALARSILEANRSSPAFGSVELDEAVVRNVSLYARAELSPLCALFGGVLAQEITKQAGKYTPMTQWFHFDAFELLSPTPPPQSTPQGSRYDHQLAVFGAAVQRRLGATKAFLVGCGALGCEYIKAFALMGLGCEGGEVTVTDDDRIELSNLSRQFLFRRKHVGLAKSISAGEAAIAMNPQLKTALKTLETRVEPKSEHVFDDAFWDGLDIVVNALDNAQARKYVDGKCVAEHDTRVLTNHGFLFLSEIEERLAAGQLVLYACYEKSTSRIVYSPGRVVITYTPGKDDPATAPEHWVDFTPAGARRLWDATSDDYGSTVAADGQRVNYLSVRTTPEHEMYVQLCSTRGDRVGNYHPRSVGPKGAQVPVPPQKMSALELAPGYVCDCDDDRTCTHGYSHYRMFTGAASGVQPPADVISLTNTDPRSPVVALGLRTQEELDAFLELFGYWLGDGSMSYDTRAGQTSWDGVYFSAKKKRDRRFLRKRLARLRLVRGRHYTSSSGGVCFQVRLFKRSWFRFFDGEFGVKYRSSTRFNSEQALLKQGMHPSQRRPLTRLLGPTGLSLGTAVPSSTVSLSVSLPVSLPLSRPNPMGLAQVVSPSVPAGIKTDTPGHGTFFCQAGTEKSQVPTTSSPSRRPLSSVASRIASRTRSARASSESLSKEFTCAECACDSEQGLCAECAWALPDSVIRRGSTYLDENEEWSGSLGCSDSSSAESEEDKAAMKEEVDSLRKDWDGDDDAAMMDEPTIFHEQEDEKDEKGAEATERWVPRVFWQRVEDDEEDEEDEDDRPQGGLRGDPILIDSDSDEPMKDEPEEDEKQPPSPVDSGDDDDEDEDDEDDDDPVPVKSAKWLPNWALHQLDRQQLRLVIEGVRQADGLSAASRKQQAAIAAGGSNMEGCMICTSGVGFRDQLLHACLLAGYSAYFTINMRAGEVRGYDAVPGDGHGIYTKKKMMAALQADPTRQFRPVCSNYDNYWVIYNVAVSEVLPAQDVRFDGGATSIRAKQERKKGWVAEHVRKDKVHQTEMQSELAKLISSSAAVISRAKDSGALVNGVWRIFTKNQYEQRRNDEVSQWTVARRTQQGDQYDPHRDGRVWCVSVQHKNQLIFVQRAHRNSIGVVTKVGRTMIVGNCVLHQKPLLESGTLGTQANSVICLPHLTPSYSEGAVAGEEQGIAKCQLHSHTPSLPPPHPPHASFHQR